MENSTIQILIAERNQNVREFLRREFLKEGYRVQVAKDGFDLCNFLRAEDKTQLVVLDADLPFMDGFVINELSEKHNNGVPIILHFINNGQADHPVFQLASDIVEKGGNPKRLITAVRETLIKHYPDHFPKARNLTCDSKRL